MKKSLPYLLVLVAVVACRVAPAQTSPAPIAPAAPAVATPATTPPPAVAADSATRSPTEEDLVRRAASQLERRASITARLRHQVTVGGELVYGVGSYWQQGSGEELKVRLELQLAGEDSQLLQVCNSRFFWIDRHLPTGRVVTRFDL